MLYQLNSFFSYVVLFQSAIQVNIGFVKLREAITAYTAHAEPQTAQQKHITSSPSPSLESFALHHKIDVFLAVIRPHLFIFQQSGWNGRFENHAQADHEFASTYSLFVDAATAFLTQAVSRLRHIFPLNTTVSRERCPATSHLWKDVVAVCAAFSAWLKTWPLGALHEKVTLHATLGSLLAWLLEVQQSASISRVMRAVTSTPEEWRQQLLIIMQVPMLCITYTNSNFYQSPKSLSLFFESGTISALIHLASELVRRGPNLLDLRGGTTPKLESTGIGFVHSMLYTLVTYLQEDPDSAAWTRLRVGPVGSCVLECIKVTLVAYASQDAKLWNEWYGSPYILLNILTLLNVSYCGMPVKRVDQPAPPSCIATSTNTAHSALSFNFSHNNRHSSTYTAARSDLPTTTTTDEALLQALKVISVREPSTLDLVNQLLSTPILFWGEPSPGGSMLLSESELRCVASITQHITSQALLWTKCTQRVARLQVEALQANRHSHIECANDRIRKRELSEASTQMHKHSRKMADLPILFLRSWAATTSLPLTTRKWQPSPLRRDVSKIIID